MAAGNPSRRGERQRHVRVRWCRVAVSALTLALVGAACSSDSTSLSAGEGADRRDGPARGQAGPVEYETQATILQDPDGEPELCVGGVAESLPPQCGGPVVVGLDWEDVPWRETANGVTWADVTAVGTFDGKTFTLTRPVRRRVLKEPDNDWLTDIECAAPPGGWKVRDPSKIGIEAQEAAGRTARRSAGFAGMWWQYTVVSGDENPDPDTAVLHFAFTESLDERRAELERVWGGPLCVVERERSYRELQTIATRIGNDSTELEASGIQLLSYGADEIDNVVSVQVILADERAVAEFRSRYGDMVVVSGALRPVE